PASPTRREVTASISRGSRRGQRYGATTASIPRRAASTGARNWSASLGLQRVGVEFVSNAADGDDQLWGRIVSFDPLPQPAYVDVDGARLDVHVLAPDQVQQLQAVVNAIGVAD